MLMKFTSGGSPISGDTRLSPDGTGQWVLPEHFKPFTAEFGREGFDLLLQSDQGAVLRLVDYFIADTPADLIAHDGATLRGSTVGRLAGPLFPAQYAQAGTPDLADAIGQVEVLTGAAFVQRTDGQIVELEIGTKVFQGDVVRTENGSTLGLTFTDGTIFTLASGSRMVLDELIYDPQANDNSGVFDLVEGSFVFIAGQTAKTGGIEINTPAATMGIRGTTGKIDIQTLNGISTVTVSLNPDPDGGLGAIELYDLAGNLITTITGTETKWIISPPFTNEPPIEVDRDTADLGDDAVLLSQAIAAFQSAITRVQQGETFVELPEGEGEVQDDATEIEEEGEEGGTDAEPIRPAPLDETGDGTEGEGESGTGNPELDGNDEPILDEDAGTGGDEDDAALEPDAGDGTPQTQTADSGTSRTIFSNLEVQSTEDMAVTSRLTVEGPSGDPVQISLARGAANGLVVLAPDGTFTYTPDPDFDGVDSFVVTGLDENGTVQSATVTVTVDPVNDAPQVALETVTVASIEEGAGTPLGSGTVTGTLAYADVDEGAVPGSWSIAPSPDNTTAFGVISIDPASGVWRYEMDQGATDTLTDGDVFEEVFVATIVDAEGASDTSTLVVTVTGTNDSPVIAATVAQFSAALVIGPGADDFDDPGPSPSGSVFGTLTYSDVDEGETVATWSIAANEGNDTAIGLMSIDPVTGVWSYVIDPGTPVALNNGETAQEVFTATVTDAFGASASQAITISITGTNDAPVIVFSIEDVSATVIEDGFGTVAADGGASTVEVGDDGFRALRLVGDEQSFERTQANTAGGPDATGTLRYVDADGQSGAASWSVEVQDATLGTMTIDAVTGEWHYFLDQEAANSLRQGDEVIETFVATVTDLFGAQASQVITITVLGTNDAAEITTNPQDLVGAVAEDGVATAAGQLSFSDPDAAPGETATWSVVADGTSRGVMTIDAETGQWLYTLDPLLADGLAADEPETETFTATVTDSLGATADQVITITLTGQNDAPVLVESSVSVAKTEPEIIINLSQIAGDPDQNETGETLSYAILTGPGEGSTELDGAALTFSTDGDFNDLGEGESRDVEIEVSATDRFGETVSGIVTVTVTGSDTGPQITSGAGEAEGDVVEAGAGTPGTATASDTLTYTDVDASTPTSGVWTVSTLSAAFGTMTIDATTGTWTYTLNDTLADALNDGQTAQERFLATITDESGLIDTQEIVVTVTGTNDAPIVVNGAGALNESDASVTIELEPLAQDPDAEDDSASLTYRIVTGPGAGNGSAALTVDNELVFSTNGDFGGLGAGASTNVTVQMGAMDARGIETLFDVVVTVTGTNSAPVITSGPGDAAGAVTEAGHATPGTAQATGTLTYSDADAATPTSGVWSIVPDITALGTMSIDATTGVWTYTLNQAAADSLEEGDLVEELFTATITDAGGLTDTQQVQILITGTNDAPDVLVASSDLDGTAETGGPATLTGQIVATDPDDFGLVQNWSIAPAGTLPPAFGSMAISNLGVWTYTVDELAVAALPAGQVRTDSFTATVEDGFGATDTVTVDITINGTNIPPTITFAAGNDAGAVTENGDASSADQQVTGQLSYNDPDEGATPASWGVVPVSASVLGSMVISGSGQWTYTLTDAASDSLDEGDVVVDEFLVTVTDAEGDSDTQTVAITITGTNDSPTLTPVGVADLAQDAIGNFDLRALSADVDDDDDPTDLTFAIVSGPAKGSASITGDGQHTLTFNTNSAFADLGAGETEDVTIDVTVEDPQGGISTATFTIRVTGTNDAPVITSAPAAAEGSIRENGDLTVPPPTSIGGTLSYSDSDEAAGSPATWSVTPLTSALGSISIGATNGVWEYTLDQTAADFLTNGDTRVEQFTATVTDTGGASATQTITVTILGTNDAPSLSAGTLAATEDGGDVTLDLDTLSGDVDAGDTLTYTIIGGSPGGSILGSTLTYNPGAGFQELAAGQTHPLTINFRAMDSNGAFRDSSVAVTVTGVNDDPTLAAATLAATEGGGAVTLDVSTLGADVDNGQNGNTLTYSLVAPPATASLVGTTLTFTPDASFDDLAVGETRDVALTVMAEDGAGGSTTNTVTVTVTGVNSAPTVLSNIATLDAFEDGAFSGVVVPGFFALSDRAGDPDSDDDANSLSYAFTNPSTGNFTVSPTEVRLVTGGNYENLGVGDEVFETIDVTVTDQHGAMSNVGTLTWRVLGQNDAPTIGNATATIGEDGGLALQDLSVLAQDVDDGATLTYVMINLPTKGFTQLLGGDLARFETDGDFENLAAGQTEDVTITYFVRDEHNAESAHAQFVVTVQGANDAPTMADSAETVAEGSGSTFIGLTADDVDDGDTLTYEIVTGPSKGTAVINGAGFDFDTNGEFGSLNNGESEFITVEVRALDSALAFSSTRTVTIEVTGVSNGPVADDSAASVAMVSRAGASQFGDNDHYYEFVRGYYEWTEANAAAGAKAGYLATITSAAENTFAGNLVASAGGDIHAWLGGSDAVTEGTWLWTSGPEVGQNFWNGDVSGSAPGGAFTNWFAGQPDPGGTALQDHLTMQRFGGGVWDDTRGQDAQGYLLEYDEVIAITGNVTATAGGGGALTYALNAPVAGLTMAADGSWEFDPTVSDYAAVAQGASIQVVAGFTVTEGGAQTDTGELTLTVHGANDAPTVVDDAVTIMAAEADPGPVGGGWSEWTTASGGNGHFYRFVSNMVSWDDAHADAIARGGHLATLTSAEEESFVRSLAPSHNAWVGGSDFGHTHNWQWEAGPETGQQFWQGFSNGSAVNGSYTNWRASEPNDSNDHYVHLYGIGGWGDAGDTHIFRYHVEYSVSDIATGTVADNDSDPEGDAITYALSGTYDGLSMAANGSWAFDRADAAYVALNDGESAFINAYYTATDAHGATSDGRLRIEVQGIDNAPVVTGETTEITLAVGSVSPPGGGWSQWTGAGANDHFYKYVPGAFTWTQARADVDTMGGYLATITSAGEQAFVDGLAGANVAYLGGSDAAVEGEWRWVEGPETGQIFWQGGIGGSAPGGAYTNWNAAQPGSAAEDVLHFFGDGTWNDIEDNRPDLPNTLFGYIAEFSGEALATGSVAGNDSDPEGQGLTYSLVAPVDGVTMDAAGNWTFDRTHASYEYIAAGAVDVIDVDYNVSDGTNTTQGTLQLELTGVNNEPVFSDVDFGSVADTGPEQFLDLLTAASDPDSTDNLSVTNFSFNWTGDGPSPNIVPVGGSIVELDPALFASLTTGESALLTMNYDVSDGTVELPREAIFEITGAVSPIEINDDNLSPGGAPLLNEDGTAAIAHAGLLSNDDDPESVGLTVVNVQDVPDQLVDSAFSDRGALLTMAGSNIFYDPSKSAQANDLAAGQTLTDTFTYTVNSGNGQTGTAQVQLVVSGLAPSGDLAPVVNATTGTGFNSGQADEYTVNSGFLFDHDGATGTVYKFGMVSVDGALPDYLNYTLSNRKLSVDQTVFTVGDAGVKNLFLSGFEGDGDYTTSPFTLVLNASGDIEYTLYGYNDAAGIPNLLEVGLDPASGLGDIVTGVNVDLSGIDGTTPSALPDLDVLDISNGQENNLTIDVDDLLNIIDGNAAGANEQIDISADSFDSVAFAFSADWSISYSSGDTQAEVTGVGGALAGLGLMATFDLAGTAFEVSS